MIDYDDTLRALVCFRHTKPVALVERSTTDKHGQPERWLICLKCFLTVPFTQVLQEKLENLQRAQELEKAPATETVVQV